MGVQLKSIAKRWMKEPGFKKGYDALEEEFSLASQLIEARSRAGLTQAEVGPYPSTGEPTATETTVATVVTQAFDPAVTSTVPDTVKSLATGGSVDPDFLAPGASMEIPITITPTGASGSTASGVLYVDGFTTGSYFGNTIVEEPSFVSVLAAIPYEYKVG